MWHFPYFCPGGPQQHPWRHSEPVTSYWFRLEGVCPGPGAWGPNPGPPPPRPQARPAHLRQAVAEAVAADAVRAELAQGRDAGRALDEAAGVVSSHGSRDQGVEVLHGGQAEGRGSWGTAARLEQGGTGSARRLPLWGARVGPAESQACPASGVLVRVPAVRGGSPPLPQKSLRQEDVPHNADYKNESLNSPARPARVEAQ